MSIGDQKYLSTDPRFHTDAINQGLARLIADVRQHLDDVQDSHAQALLSATVHTLTELRATLSDYETHGYSGDDTAEHQRLV